MKKTFAISFLLMLFFSHTGYCFFYMFHKYQIKKAVKHELLAKLPESSLEIIDTKANKGDIEWEAENKEFYLHGQMHDVAFIKVINSKTLIYCLNDSKEELLKRLADTVKSVNKKNNANINGHHIIKLQLSNHQVLNQHLIVTISEPAAVKCADYSTPLITNITAIFTPAPDLILKNKT